MYCSNCGSELNGTTCPVCGRSLPANARGAIDATTGLMLGGWWRRVGATFADDLVLFLPTSLVVSLFTQIDGPYFGGLSAVILYGIYMIKLWSGPRGQTVGNRVAATRVRDATTGHAVTFMQAVKRWSFFIVYTVIELTTGRFAISIVLFVATVDYLYPLFNARKQTLHDKFANTIVVVA